MNLIIEYQNRQEDLNRFSLFYSQKQEVRAMLDLAIRHIPELQAKYQAIMFHERFKFFHRTPGFDYFLPVTDSCDNGVQYVSIDKGEVIGYLAVKFNRLTKTAYDYEAIKFTPGYSPVFSQDMGNFDLKVFNEFGFDRLIWSVVIGNPAERFYDALSKICGVRIVGTFKDDVMLSDGQLYDLKFYELLKDDFTKAVNENKLTPLNYRHWEVEL